MKKQTLNKIMSISFAAGLITVMAINIIKPDIAFSQNENRYLQLCPKPTVKTIFDGQFMSEFESYTSDQFIARDFWVSSKASLEQLSNKQENNKVYFGKDNYLIEKLEVVDYKKIDRNLNSIIALAQKGNCNIKTIIAPTAANILVDKLPENAYLPYQRDLIEYIDKKLKSVGEFIDLTEEFTIENKYNKDIYYKTDHHWTSYGAYIAYVEFAKSMGFTAHALEDYNITTVSDDFFGTVWSKNAIFDAKADKIDKYTLKNDFRYKLSYTEGTETTTIDSLYSDKYLETKDKYSYFADGNHPLVKITSDNPEATGKLLIFKDSYAHALVPFLAPHYKEIHMIDLRYFNINPLEYIQENNIENVLFMYNAANFAVDISPAKLGIFLK